jgi:hypothetical protein
MEHIMEPVPAHCPLCIRDVAPDKKAAVAVTS